MLDVYFSATELLDDENFLKSEMSPTPMRMEIGEPKTFSLTWWVFDGDGSFRNGGFLMEIFHMVQDVDDDLCSSF